MKTTRSYFLVVAVLLLVLASVFPLRAQVTTGSIRGFVTDPSGAAVPGTQVTVTNTDAGVNRTIVSQEDGSYRALLLPPGRYSVSFSKEGFQTLVREDVVLAVSQEVRVDASLKVGEVAQKITVTTEGAVVDTQSIQLTSEIESKQLQELPIAGNRFLPLAALSPGVIPPNQGYGVNTRPDNNWIGVDPQAAGARFNETDYQFDSSHYRHNASGNSSNLPSSRSVQEFQVIRNNFSAEYGLTSGLVVNAVTKSGTNDIHGEGYETWGNDILNTRTFNSPSEKPIVRYNQFGANVGGPVRIPWLYNGRDKTFFFFHYEGIRQPGTTSVAGGIPPTTAQRGGDFSALGEPIIDPVTLEPFPGNIITPDRFDQVGKFVIDSLPQANAGNEYRDNFSASRSENQYTIRIDHNLTQNSRLFGRYFHDTPKERRVAGGSLPTFVKNVSNQVQNRDVTLNHVHTFSPSLINQFTFGYNRTPQLHVIPNEGDNFLDFEQVGIKGWNGETGPPHFLFGALGSADGDIASESGDRTYQVTDTASWIHGRHATKFGFAYSRWRVVSVQGVDGEQNGTFFFNGSFAGHPYADLLLGRTSELYKAATIPLDAVMSNSDFYVQNDMNLSRRFTLNLGLRYRISPYYKPKNGLGGTFVPFQKSRVVPSAPAGLLYIGDEGVPDTLIKTDYNDFSPRVGIAIDPTGSGNTSIRAGYGIYYNLRNSEYANVQYTPPYGVTVDFLPYSLSDPFRDRANPFPYQFDPNNAQFFPPLTLYPTVDPNQRSAYVHAWNLTLQRQVKAVVVEAGYTGRASHKLPSSYLVNPAIYIPGTDADGNPLSTPGNVDQRRIYQGFGAIWYQASYANGNFHALQMSARGRLSQNLLITTAWTYGHSIDDASSPRYDTTAVNNPFNRRLDRGNSDFDIRHIFTASLIWDLPRLTGSPAVARTILGGWSLSALFNAQTGRFGTAHTGEDRSLSGIFYPYERANQVLEDIYLPDDRPRGEKLQQWINPNAFALPEIGTFGNAGRNTIRGPGRWVSDMSLHKTFTLGEGVLLRFRADAYNVFNHTRLGVACHELFYGTTCLMDNLVNSGTFGRFPGAESGRTIQLGGAIQF
jgi:hypothetical protein